MSQFVRDLRWAIESPSLIDDTCSVDRLSCIDSEDLEGFLSDWNGHRVGYYFEHLIHYWLLRIRRVNVAGKGVQICDGNRTIGEVDFLFHDEAGQLTHLETAVKFYLYLPDNSTAESCFIGPNPADNFERKMNRLFGHQLPVSEPAFPDIQKRLAFVKGRVFYHPELGCSALLPKPMSHNHLQNTWLHHNDIDWFHEVHGTGMFRILQKPHWLADDLAAVGDESLMTASELTAWLNEHFESSQRPCLVSVLATTGKMNSEVDRVFVVSDSWPAF